MIDQFTIERIQSAAQISDVVSDFVTLRKRGVNYVGLCPFHEDKTPSFYVSPAKNICKCFACGEGGTPVHFVMKHEQLTYYEALKYLAKKYGIEVNEIELTDEQKQAQGDRESMFILNGFAQKMFSSNLFDHLEGKTVGFSYFKERGFREDTIRKFQLGYSLEVRDGFTKQALNSGYKLEFLEKTGLTIVREDNYVADRFRGRVMFPVLSLAGKVVAFGGRTLKKDDKTAKYVNSPESEIYHKGNELYGIYFARQAIVKHDRCFLVEGYTDVISMHQAGIENVVASSGTALTQGQIRLIHRFTNNVTVLYDGDAAGIKAAIRGIDLLLEAGLNIKVVLLPEGEDPDSFAQKQNASHFIEYIKKNETDFVRFKTSLLIEETGNDPIKKARLINEIVDTIAIIPEEIIRSVYVKECSRLLDTDERILVRAIAKKRKELAEQKLKLIKQQSGITEQFQTEQNDASPSGMPGTQPETLLPADTKTSSDTFFDSFEKAILLFVIRYGEHILYTTENPDNKDLIAISVAEYITQDLEQDELVFENPVYRQILAEASGKCKQEGFTSERYFLNHPDPDISRLAADLVSDKYPLSKIHSKFKKMEEESERLVELVPYEVMNYKDAILKKRMENLNLEIKIAQEENDTGKVTQLMTELSLLWQESKKLLAKHLGERIILKL
ncbi:MAG: DNA primase [Dysgonamonadaceae bacterium]|jgi:DNA primase|nr:DNA primase [Dysgonamonadaceae bacterium]